ncbi:MAG: HEAT repeat domain-containing protein [Candidatus Hydrogenedentes bacterium]|nr:HEAT repeat domain-containing protein [Candidatus Hydrogenedentota bacterium]
MCRFIAMLMLLLLVAPVLRAEEDRFERCAHVIRLEDPDPAAPQFGRGRPFDVQHIRIEVALDFAKESVAGNTTLSLVPVGKPASEVELDAVDLVIHGAVDGAGTALTFDVSEDKLRVYLPAPVPAGQAFQVTIRHEVHHPRKGMYFRTPRKGYTERETQAWTQGEADEARHWFPCIDFPNERATSEIIATVPGDMRVLSNGELVEETRDTAANTATFHWRLDHEHTTYLISLLAGRFSELKAEGSGVPIYYYVLPGFEAMANNSFGLTPAMMTFFQERFAMPYPFGRYSQVAVADFIAGGMENTSITTLTERTLHDDAAHLTYSSDDLVSHELAHQWFGDLITCRDWSHLWLNEGFATYSESLFNEAHFGQDLFYHGLWEMSEKIGARDNQKDNPPVVWREFKEPFDLFTYRVYEKGAWVLHMLRRKLGDELFFAGLQAYLQRYQNQVVETNDLMRTLEAVSGMGLEAFFAQWVYASGIPELSVTYTWEAAQQAARVEIAQTQAKRAGGKVFTFDVPMRFMGDGWTKDHTLHIDTAEDNVLIPLPGKPRDFRFDPEESLLKKLTLKKTEEMWQIQLAEDPVASGKYQALAWFAKQSSPQAVEHVARSLESDAFWGVRVKAAEALGDMETPAAIDALVQGLDDTDARVRRAVIAALGTFDKPAAVTALLDTVKGGEPSPYVLAGAVDGLNTLRKPESLEAALPLLDRESHNGVLRDAVLRLMGDLADTDDIHALERFLPGAGPRDSWNEAIAAVAQWGWNNGKTQRAAAILKPFLTSENRGVRRSALAAFRSLDDPRTLPALESYLETAKDAGEQEEIKAAIKAIREGRRTPDQVLELRDDVDLLKDERRELQDKVEELERQIKAVHERIGKAAEAPKPEVAAEPEPADTAAVPESPAPAAAATP